MIKIRSQLMSKLNEIETVVSGVPIPDAMVENGQTYFGYELQEVYVDSDTDNNYTMEIFLTGRLVRKQKTTENTIEILDTALDEIKQKLKALNFKYSYNDISEYSDGFRKILVKANVKYNELINKLV